MSDPVAPVSPTGKPLVPASVVPYLAALAAVALVVAGLAEASVFGAQSPLIAKLAEGASALMAVLLGTSPGLRAKVPDAGAAVNSGPAAVEVINKVP